MVKAFVTTCASVALVAAMTVGGGASTLDKRTLFTFNHSIALPGMTLPGGTYMFRLADPMSSERFIEVADARGLKSYAVFPAQRIERARGAREAVMFRETAPGSPMAVQAWWYSGERYGYEFIYTDEQLARLEGEFAGRAEVVQPDIVMTSLTPAPVASVTPAPAIDEVETSRVADPVRTPAVEQTPQPGAPQTPAPAPRTDPAPADPAPAPSAAQRELPRTAGPLPMAFLAGIGAIAAGFWMARRGRARS